MPALRILIADDEMPARSKMRRLLAAIEDVEVVYAAENGIEALEHIHALKPDLVFLDIEMPGMTGMEVARGIELSPAPAIVFTTAYSEYALSAFEVNALDYLLKPFNEDRLQAVIDRVKSGQAKSPTRDVLDQLSDDDDDVPADASEEAALRQALATKLAVPVRDRFRILDFSEISCIEVEERSVRLFAGKDAFVVNQTLDAFEKRLPMSLFFRINRSTVVGVGHIREVVIWFGNRYKIIMQDGKEVISSREKSRAIKQILKL